MLVLFIYVYILFCKVHCENAYTFYNTCFGYGVVGLHDALYIGYGAVDATGLYIGYAVVDAPDGLYIGYGAVGLADGLYSAVGLPGGLYGVVGLPGGLYGAVGLPGGLYGTVGLPGGSSSLPTGSSLPYTPT